MTPRVVAPCPNCRTSLENAELHCPSPSCPWLRCPVCEHAVTDDGHHISTRG